MIKTNWMPIYLGAAAVLIVALIMLIMAVPRDGDEILWTEQMVQNGWMAWSFPIALFFWCETPRVGIIGIETTRGDRLFITLLGSAFINIAWLGLEVGPQPWALAVCAVYGALVFWKV